MRLLITAFLSAMTVSPYANVVDEPGGSAYHYVKAYRVSIAASPRDVWPHVMNLGGWMYDFEMATVSGTPGEVGSVVRLYEGQAFKTLLTAVEPERLLVMANLPSTDRGETGTGIGVVQLTGLGNGRTEVSLIMNRRYDWSGNQENFLRQTRQSFEFNQSTDAMWHRFLDRLKAMAEDR